MTVHVRRKTMGNDTLNVVAREGLCAEVYLAAAPERPLARAELKIAGAKPAIRVRAGARCLKVTARTARFTVAITTRVEPGWNHARQEIIFTALEDGRYFLDDIRYEIALCPADRDPQVFVPTHWAYLGPASGLPALDTFYHRATIFDGYKDQIRTPAVSAWGKRHGVTVGLPTPLAHLSLNARSTDTGRRSPCFSFSFEKPAYGPDHYELAPHLKKEETLAFSAFLHPHPGDWETGMKGWMDYHMRHNIRDAFNRIAWLDGVKLIWIKWEGATRAEIDGLARLGVKAIEVYPWTEPSPELLAYIHSKGIRVLMEHYALSSYEIRPEEKTALGIKGSERDRSRLTSRRVADRHPDWVLSLLPGDEGLHDIYIHMDPHAKGFRQAKVKEAVDLVRKGYDGIRYDNLILPNGISQGRPYAATYAAALQTLLREIKTAVRKINPEAVIAANNAGPDAFNLTDVNMYEAGLSSESHLMEQAGKTDWEKSSYDRAHLRMLTAKCIWQFAGKPLWVWDYPKGKTGKKLEKQWILRSILFDLLHDAIIGLATPKDLGAIAMAMEVAGLAGEPLSGILAQGNLVLRYYGTGTVLAMETKSRPWVGTVAVPAAVARAWRQRLPPGTAWRLYSEDRYHLKCARLRTLPAGRFRLELGPDGCAVLAAGRARSKREPVPGRTLKKG